MINISIETIGLLASLTAIIMFISPIAQIQSIRKIKKSDEVSPALYIAMVVNCSLWTIYGAGIENWYILTPNAIGAVLGILTLTVIYRYR
ncbi:MAG: MtN3/saliva family [Methanobacterium sp. Maddingley MBC34]|nr:MAG: MtN3/saliva family [Methanobacterium sp. Maddingley MBC34]